MTHLGERGFAKKDRVNVNISFENVSTSYITDIKESPYTNNTEWTQRNDEKTLLTS